MLVGVGSSGSCTTVTVLVTSNLNVGLVRTPCSCNGCCKRIHVYPEFVSVADVDETFNHTVMMHTHPSAMLQYAPLTHRPATAARHRLGSSTSCSVALKLRWHLDCTLLKVHARKPCKLTKEYCCFARAASKGDSAEGAPDLSVAAATGAAEMPCAGMAACGAAAAVAAATPQLCCDVVRLGLYTNPRVGCCCTCSCWRCVIKDPGAVLWVNNVVAGC